MTIGERIKSIRKKIGISQVDFADRIGVSKQTLYKYENNIITNIPSDKIEAIASIAHVSPAFIMGWIDSKNFLSIENAFPIELKRSPMSGEISCGKPRCTDEDRKNYVIVGLDIKADFCLLAKDDSMINARIHDGDIVFIRKQDIVENGEIAAVMVNNNDEATLRRIYYYQEKALMILRPENSNYQDLIYTGEELNQVHILGKAIAFQSDVK